MIYRTMSFAFAVSLAWGFATPAWSEDTPSNMSQGVADPLAGPRTAIANGSWVQAVTLLEEARRSGVDSADLHNLLGYSLRKKSPPDLDRALTHYRLALEREPAHRGALEYMGEAYLMLRRPDEARRLLDTLQKVCGGTACEEYVELRQAIEDYR